MKDIEVSLFKSYLFEKDIKSNPTCRASTVYLFFVFNAYQSYCNIHEYQGSCKLFD